MHLRLLCKIMQKVVIYIAEATGAYFLLEPIIMDCRDKRSFMGQIMPIKVD